ncbi:MAG: Mth938-like domain-containing protein [Omnitrophica WOR_2 bacterium]
MKPRIDKTKFGSITIAGAKYDHDVIIRLNGKVEKRKKKLSKEIFGTSHVISLAEAEYVYEDSARWLLIGTGQSGMVKLSDEAAQFLKKKGCQVALLPTPEAMRCWNESEEAGIGLFHITC